MKSVLSGGGGEIWYFLGPEAKEASYDEMVTLVMA